MADMDNRLKLLFSAFIVLLLGVVLIRPIADNISEVSQASINVANESVTMTAITATIVNESISMSNASVGAKGNLTNNHLIALTVLRNNSGGILTDSCTITLAIGNISCQNATNVSTIFADYTFNDVSTGTLANDELITFDACRNSTGTTITAGLQCNVTIPNGAVTISYDNVTDGSAFIAYTYTPDNFVRGRTTRSLLNLTILFFAILILSVGLGFAMKSFKEGGLM